MSETKRNKERVDQAWNNCMTVWMLTDFCYQTGRIENVCLHPCCGSGGLWLLYGSE